MIESTAEFSKCGQYRYTLHRKWSDGGRAVNFLMLNPSTADHVENDPTVERCVRRAQAMGFDELIVTNIFALRSTDPKALYTHHDPIGLPENNTYILSAALPVDTVVCAWGNHGGLMSRGVEVYKLLLSRGVMPKCLTMTKAGQPSHPLYLPYSLQPVHMEHPI